MSRERLLELAALAALEALDGEDRAFFEARGESFAAVERELAAYRELTGRLGLATPPTPPSAAVRARVLELTRPAPRRRAWLVPALAGALLAALAGLLLVIGERDAARREAASATARAEAARAEAAALRESVAADAALRVLMSLSATRVATLDGLAPAKEARARVVWHDAKREGVFVASGLEPAPPGKAYELWVIGTGAPVPAGVFQADAEGRAVHRLPAGLELAGVRTFAVTVEPEAGVPAPTGAMVLAGTVS
jgi:anti-sigma-K factor RskA